MMIEWTHILLAITWGYTFCSHMNCQIEPRPYFTIHGLWPTTAYPPYPEYCDPDLIYDPDVIKPIQPELEEFWPSYLNDYQTFWKHEWDKHGTCSVCIPEVGDQYKYFEHSLDLYYYYDPLTILINNGIYPGSEYNRTDFEEVLGSAYYMQCHSNKLEEIRISFNETWDLIPSPIDHRCPDVIDFYIG
jgi:ribonuclease I